MAHHRGEDPALAAELTEYDYRYLRSLWGFTRAGCAYLLGVSERTLERYDAHPSVSWPPGLDELAA